MDAGCSGKSSVSRDEWAREALGKRNVGGIVWGHVRPKFVGPDHQRAGRKAGDGQLVVAHDHLEIGCSPKACLREHCENLFVELDEQFVWTGHNGGQPIEVVTWSAKFSLGPSHVNRLVAGCESLDCSCYL